MRPTLLVVAACAALLAGPSTAADGAPRSRDGAGAYELVPAEGRHLKIDRGSGAVSLCAETGGRWRCELLPDDRVALEEEIARLRAENDRLRAEIDEMRRGDGGFGPDDEKKLEEFFTFSDKAFRHFFGMVQDLRRDLEAEKRI